MTPAPTAVRTRAALLWLSATLAGAWLASVTAPLATGRVPTTAGSFDDLVVQGCAAVALVAAALLWLACTDVALAVWRAPGRRRLPTGPLRRALLAACGVAVLATASPAAADPPADGESHGATEVRHALDGLPLPDRADGAVLLERPAGAVVRARPGDSLWSIAARTVGPEADRAELAAYWHRVVALNAAATGADPDLIHPGQQVRLPPR